jgi:hypothetical protein
MLMNNRQIIHADLQESNAIAEAVTRRQAVGEKLLE